MVTDIENQIDKQLQDRLNQEKVATAPLAKELEPGDRRSCVPLHPHSPYNCREALGGMRAGLEDGRQGGREELRVYEGVCWGSGWRTRLQRRKDQSWISVGAEKL